MKYKVLTVIYAPPGTKGGSSTSSVSYGSESMTGTTTTGASSFKQDYSVTATVTFGLDCTGQGANTECPVGVGGGASYEYANNETHSNALDVKKTTSSTILVNGPNVHGVDHDLDTIWLLLRVKIFVSISGKTVEWTFDNAKTDPPSINIPIYVYVRDLKDPSKMPPGTLRALQAAGITPEDYPEILKADPLTTCPVPCVPPAPPAPRFVSAFTSIPYEPPPDPRGTVPVQTNAVDNSAVSTHTDSYEESHKFGLTAQGSVDFLPIFGASLKSENSWTWTDTNTTATSTGTRKRCR